MDADTQPTPASIPVRLVRFPNTDGSRVPFDVYRSQEIYDREQERIFRGPTWSFLALEAEIPNPGDFKSTFVGDTPVVVARTEDNELAAWVNRCAHRSAMVCRTARGNAMSHTCVYHQWTYSTTHLTQRGGTEWPAAARPGKSRISSRFRRTSPATPLSNLHSKSATVSAARCASIAASSTRAR
jgi:nitrite reductase/ring-hydroxylating ferredoxin subunit